LPTTNRSAERPRTSRSAAIERRAHVCRNFQSVAHKWQFRRPFSRQRIAPELLWTPARPDAAVGTRGPLPARKSVLNYGPGGDPRP